MSVSSIFMGCRGVSFDYEIIKNPPFHVLCAFNSSTLKPESPSIDDYDEILRKSS